MRTPCIPCRGKPHRDGYGRAQFEGRQYQAHRVAYVLHRGRHIDDICGVVVRHECDNRACVNPEHLITGTQADNLRDMDQRGRRARGMTAGGAKLTDEQVREIRAEFSRPSVVQAEIARRYGVSKTLISYVVRAMRRTHLTSHERLA